MSKKNVLIVINSLSQGGAERVVSILLEQFYHDSAFYIELVLLEDEIAYEIPAGVQVTTLSSFTNRDGALKKTLAIPLLAYKLARYVKKRNFDLVVSFLYRADFVNVLASYIHKKPVIVSERVNASSTYAQDTIQAKINKYLIRKLYPKAAMVINVSEGTKMDLVENFGVESHKQIVIYNPYNIEKIQNLSSRSLDIDMDKSRTIVALSRFRPIKNIEMILKAFSYLPEDKKFIVIGDGEREAALHMLAKELGIYERVLFVGRQDNPYKYLKNASIYVSASLSEGFPNALVEAMICGCAVISTDCPSGPREILAPKSSSSKRLEEGLEYGEYGLLVAMNDVTALQEGLKKLFEEDTLLQYQKQSLKRIEDFDVKYIFEKYKKVFESVIEGKSV